MDDQQKHLHPLKNGIERPFHRILAYLTWLQGHYVNPLEVSTVEYSYAIHLKNHHHPQRLLWLQFRRLFPVDYLK